MKSALLQYPYGEVFEPLERLFKRKGFSRVKIDPTTGVLHASRGLNLFGNPIEVEMKVEKVDDQITKVNVIASSFKLSPGSKDLDELEDKLINTIYKYF